MSNENAKNDVKSPRRARWGRRMLWALALSPVLLVLLPLLLWGVLVSPFGERVLRTELLGILNEQFVGRIEAESIRLSGLLSIDISNAKLFAPDESVPVVDIERFEAEIELLGLLSRRIDVSRVQVTKPKVRLESDARGLNISRAFESRTPSEAEEDTAPSTPWGLRISAFFLKNGQVSSRGLGPAVELEAFELEGSLQGTVSEFELESEARAQLHQPLERPVLLEAKGSVSTAHLDLERLLFEVGNSRLEGDLRLEYDLSDARLGFDMLRVAPEELVRFAPDLGLKGTVSMKGEATLRDGKAELGLFAELPAGTLSLDAGAELALESEEPVKTWRAKAELVGVDGAALLESLPKTSFTGSVEAKDGVGMPGSGTARVSISTRKARYLELPIQRLKIEGTLEALSFQVGKLEAQTAGVELVASGRVDSERGKIKGTVESSDLEATRIALRRGLSLELPQMSGSALAELSLDGPWANPALGLVVRTPKLEVSGVKIRTALVDARILQFSPYLKMSGTASVEELRSGALVGKGLEASGTLDGREVLASLDGELSEMRVAARLKGRREQAKAGVHRWKIDELSASALGLRMESQHPVLFEMRGERFSVDELDLRGDLGRLVLAGSGGLSGPLDARLTLEGLRIEKIPPELMPEGTKVAGLLGASVIASGSAKKPQLDARARLEGARVEGIFPIDLTLEARLAESRLKASVEAWIVGESQIAASIDLPASLPAEAPKQAPVSASLLVERVNASLLRAFVKESPLQEGVARAKATLSGTWGRPQIEADLFLSKAAAWGVSEADASARVDWKEGQLQFSANLTRGEQLDASLEGSTPLEASAVAEGRLPSWRQLPVKGELRLTTLALGWLAPLLQVQDLRGSVSGRVLFAGTSEAPELATTVALRNVNYGDYRGLDATADLRLREDLDLRLESFLGGVPALEMHGKAQVSAAELMTMSEAQLWLVPLSVDARLLPTALSKLMPADEGLARGLASATMTLKGTADAPRLETKGLVELSSMANEQIGKIVLDAGYDGARTQALLRFDSARSGTLVARLLLPGSLSGRSLTTPEGRNAVLSRRSEISAATQDFDVSVLEGMLPAVSGLAGRLDLQLRKSGPLLEAGGEGTLSLRQLKVIFDYGEVWATDMEFAFNWPSFELKRLSGYSGDGRFNGAASLASNDRGQSFRGKARLEFDKIPLVQHFETKGWISMLAETQLELKEGLLTMSPLKVSKGLLKIADSNVTRSLTGQGKDIQSLEQHPDLVFTSEMRERRRKEAKKAAKKAEKAAAGEEGTPFRADLRLTIPNDFVVEAPLGNTLTLGANLKITWDPTREAKELDPLDIEGRVSVIQGTVNVLRRFDVKKGQLNFRSGQWKNPDIDIEATHEGSDGTLVSAALGGTLDSPTRRFLLKPPGGEAATGDEAEIIFYLTTGRRQTRANTTSPDLDEALANAGFGALSSLAGSGVKWLAGKVLPAELMPDVLSVDTDLRSGAGVERVRAGKYFTDRIYLGGQYNRGANVEQGESLFELEGSYRLTDESSLKLRGSQGAFGAEITYEKDIPTKQQRKAKQSP